MRNVFKWLLLALLVFILIIVGVPAVMLLFGLFMMFKSIIFE